MVPWVPEWVQGVYAYVTGTRRRRPNRPRTPSPGAGHRPASSSSSPNQHNEVLGVKGAGVKKRSPAPKSGAGKQPRKKKKKTTGRDAGTMDEDEMSSERITAAEQAAVNEESAMESPERLDRDDPKCADWTDAEIILFNQLQDRGLEPLLATSYQLDFPTLPDEVFTSDNQEIFIDSRKGNTLHATRALQSLFRVGTRIRPRMLERRHASHILLRTINAYVKWAMEDASIIHRDLLPILLVKGSRANENHLAVIKRMRTDLSELAERHRERYDDVLARAVSGKRKWDWLTGSLNNSGPKNTAVVKMPDNPNAVPPVLFGVIIVQGVMTFTALDASVADAEMKIVGIFDWAQPGQDVWNALAIAILVTMVRNYQESVGGEVMESLVASDDPDA